MASTSLISLFSAFISIIAVFIVFLIINKVYQEDYKRPWLFIGISILFLAMSNFLDFLSGFFGIYLGNKSTNYFFSLVLQFISISILTYAILLEFMILKYFKGKFVKFKFVPVQEGTMGGELDIDVSKANSYFTFKKDKKFLNSQFSQATKKGFEGFLITEENPIDIRKTYLIEKTPIAWISQINSEISSDYLKKSLGANSDIVEPINLNNLITYTDNFLEQSSNPFVMIDLNLILKLNNFPIVLEFLKYISSKIKKYDGILICNVNEDVISDSEKLEFTYFLKNIE